MIGDGSSSNSPRKPGRPRDPGRDQLILDVTLRHLAERGYARMSMDAIAAEARVGKPTLYLRWPNKAELATAAIAHLREVDPVEPTGNVRADLIQHLRRLRNVMQTMMGVSFLGALLAEERQNPALLARFRDAVVRPRRQLVRALLLDARARGEIAPDTDVDTVIALLFGAFYGRYVSGDPIPDDWAEAAVDLVWQVIAPSSTDPGGER